jgi:hypothetical protein
MGTGFWKSWLDGTATVDDAKRLREADATIADHTADAIGSLRRLIDHQNRELERLRATVRVLASLLVESGAVEESTLDYRLEAAFAELAPEEPPAARSPSALGTAEFCSRCGAALALARAHQTPSGTLCEECFRGVGA